MDKIKTLKFKNGLELPLLNTSDCNAHNCIKLFKLLFNKQIIIIIIINAERTIITNSSMSRNYVEFRL